MIGHYGFLVVLHKITIVLAQLIINLLIFGSLLLIRISIRLVELFEMIFKRLLVRLYTAHRLLQLLIITLNPIKVTSNSVS
jgi:hypothetical protein